MSLVRKNLTRVFMYSAVPLADPDPSMSIVAVRDLYAAAGKPELSNAEVRGPETVGNQLVYTFHRAVGTKGADEASMRKGFEALRAKKCLLASEAVSLALSAMMANKGRPLPLPSQAVPWML